MKRKVKVAEQSKTQGPTAAPVEDLYLFGEIYDRNAAETVQQIECCRRYGVRLRLWICSLGGDLGGALAIHDALQRAEGSIAIATGNCQSAALQAFLGAEHRFCTPNTIFLNHDVAGEAGERLPSHLELPALGATAMLPVGTFDSARARKYGITNGPEVGGGRFTGLAGEIDLLARGTAAAEARADVATTKPAAVSAGR